MLEDHYTLKYHKIMSDDNTAITGKKIFFVHPSVFVKNEIISELIQLEYEAYIIKDEDKLKKVLAKYPDSVVFASIDEALSAAKWEAWIRSVLGAEATMNIKMGVLSNTNNEDSRRLYLQTLPVPCGFIPIKLEKTRVIKTLTDTLDGLEARGLRKHIRADTRSETLTTINIPHNGTYVSGEILDISVVGLSCVFTQDPDLEFKKNSLLSDIQIKLQSVLIKAEAIVFGSREDQLGKVYVLLFTQKVDASVRAKIRIYIQKNLQTRMEDELK
jgi:hypothetical protein